MKESQSTTQLKARISGLEKEIARFKNANKGLAAVEKHYRTLVENTTDVSWRADLQLRLEYMSPSSVNFSGFSLEEIRGVTPKDSYAASSLQVVTEKFGELLESAKFDDASVQKTVKFEAEILCKDGSSKWAEITGSVLRDNGGKAIGLHGFTRDISHRKDSERMLKDKDMDLSSQTEHLEEVRHQLRKASIAASNAGPLLQQHLRMTLETMVMPYLDRLRDLGHDVEQAALVSVLRSNVAAILTHISGNIQDPLPELSHKELEVAWLVRNGETSQNIAKTMNISKRSVDFYRGKLRKKFGLEGPGDSLMDRLACASLPQRSSPYPTE